jgi:hypothetical protein
MIYDEIYSGPLEDEQRLSWPDMLILTGMNSTFDRMLHLTAYVRTKNKKVIVVAGGPIIRNIPKYASRFFDYPCTGDIEQLQFVIEEAFGRDYVSNAFLENGWAIPRYDLAYFMKDMVYVESSRYCNYRCNYCGLSAENKKYQPYDLAYLQEQFDALGKRKLVLFLDNNFGGLNRRFLLNTPQVTLPAFITLAIPLLGTPFFFECVKQKRFLPNVKIRDLDGKTLSLKPVDPLSQVLQFVKAIQCLAGYRTRILRHEMEFFRIYRKVLPPESMFTVIYNSLLLSAPDLATAPTDIGRVLMSRYRYKRTFLSTTEALDPVYTPTFRVDSRYEPYFKPTMLTDGQGNLTEALQEDLAPASHELAN